MTELFQEPREKQTHCPTRSCGMELIQRHAGMWCPRCRGWLIVASKPDGRMEAWIDTAVKLR